METLLGSGSASMRDDVTAIAPPCAFCPQRRLPGALEVSLIGVAQNTFVFSFVLMVLYLL